MAIDRKPILAYLGGEALETKMLDLAERLDRAVGPLQSVEEALVLVEWLNGGLLEPELEPLDETTIGYKEAAAIVAALPGVQRFSYEEIVARHRRSTLRGPEYDSASRRLLEAINAVGWTNSVPPRHSDR